MKSIQQIVLALTIASFGATVLHAADLNKSIQDTESRRKAAESGLHQIKTKSASDAQTVRAAYDEAATQNNAWAEQVVQALTQPSPAAPDVASIADKAASTFVAWVAVRNRSLGEFELAGPAADAVKKKVVLDLTDIANEAWKNNRQRDQGKRATFAKSLADRTRWKSWDQVQ